MGSTRACDRCWGAKTQCDGIQPCTRCVRLKVECLSERPRKKRGRPGKSDAANRRIRSAEPDSETVTVGDELQPDHSAGDTEQGITASSPAVGDSNSSITTADDRYSTRDPQTSVANSDNNDSDPIVVNSNAGQNESGQHFFTPSGPATVNIDQLLPALHCSSLSVGFLSPLRILLAAPDWQSISDGNRNALMALSLELDYHPLDAPDDPEVEPQLIIDSCRIQALNSVPALVWKSCDMLIDHVVILSLFSFTWCMKPSLTDIAYRWNNLAELVWSDPGMRRAYQQRSNFEPSLCRCLDLVLSLQSLSLRLLVHKVNTNRDTTQPSSMSLRDFLATDQTSPSSSITRNSDFANGLVDDFVHLFEPLVEPLSLVLNQNPRKNCVAQVRDLLEIYYIDFPSRLLSFSAITHTYQAEAMIWLHGIHILAWTGEDLIDIMFGHVPVSSSAFYVCYEHAILMIEVMPALLRIDPELRLISPTTVYFLVLAGSVLCAALVQFHIPIEPPGCTELLPSAPSQLLQIASDYTQAFDIIARVGSRFEVDFIHAIAAILVQLRQGIDERAVDIVDRALRVMTRYRWRGNGKGIVSLTDEETKAVWNHPLIDLEVDLRLSILRENNDDSSRREWIARLSSWESRVCKPGYFDLSIQFL